MNVVEMEIKIYEHLEEVEIINFLF